MEARRRQLEDGESDCPAFVQHEVEGGTLIRVGPRCADEEIPYSL
jgi:hypothetical protein